MEYTLSSFLFFILFYHGNAESDDLIRKNLNINSCSPIELTFDNESSSPSIEVNGHCGQKLKFYESVGAGSSVVDGYYETYGTFLSKIHSSTFEYYSLGRKLGATKYEQPLNNGTIYRLQRESGVGWVLMRSDLKVMYFAKSKKKSPPRTVSLCI